MTENMIEVQYYGTKFLLNQNALQKLNTFLTSGYPNIKVSECQSNK